MLRYFKQQLINHNVTVHLNRKACADELKDFDEIIIATGVIPRAPNIEGIDHPSVLSYINVIRDKKPVGSKVAIIGGGGIGFDVAEFLTTSTPSPTLQPALFNQEWGIDISMQHRGGLVETEQPPSSREIIMLQRKQSKMGATLGKTTGWIHRLDLQHKKVKMLTGVEYLKIDDQGLHIKHAEQIQVLNVDNIILCAGQDSLRELADALITLGKQVHIIGGAHTAAELDAKAAIKQACYLAATL